jgi:hypothetical protein
MDVRFKPEKFILRVAKKTALCPSPNLEAQTTNGAFHENGVGKKDICHCLVVAVRKRLRMKRKNRFLPLGTPLVEFGVAAHL